MDVSVGQSGHVWFLAGANSGPATRTADVPVATPLLDKTTFLLPTQQGLEKRSLVNGTRDEQWSAEGAKDHDTRGREKAAAMLAAYEEPKLDEGVAEGLRDFIARRESELPNNVS